MRRQRKIERVFFDIMLQGGIASFGIIGVTVVFAKNFGEFVLQAIPYISALLTLTVMLFLIGFIGWFFTRSFNR